VYWQLDGFLLIHPVTGHWRLKTSTCFRHMRMYRLQTLSYFDCFTSVCEWLHAMESSWIVVLSRDSIVKLLCFVDRPYCAVLYVLQRDRLFRFRTVTAIVPVMCDCFSSWFSQSYPSDRNHKVHVVQQGNSGITQERNNNVQNSIVCYRYDAAMNGLHCV